jgi:hypothetical protein
LLAPCLQVLPEQHAAFDAFGSSSSAMAEEGLLMDGFAPPAGAMYAMFPDEQELTQQEWDAYGAVVDTTELRKTNGECLCGVAAMPTRRQWLLICCCVVGAMPAGAETDTAATKDAYVALLWV